MDGPSQLKSERNILALGWTQLTFFCNQTRVAPIPTHFNPTIKHILTGWKTLGCCLHQILYWIIFAADCCGRLVASLRFCPKAIAMAFVELRINKIVNDQN